VGSVAAAQNRAGGRVLIRKNAVGCRIPVVFRVRVSPDFLIIDNGDENKVVERSGIGYNSPHLDAEFAKRSAVALEIFDSVLKFDAPGF